MGRFVRYHPVTVIIKATHSNVIKLRHLFAGHLVIPIKKSWYEHIYSLRTCSLEVL
jgi:hypothetical protein